MTCFDRGALTRSVSVASCAALFSLLGCRSTSPAPSAPSASTPPASAAPTSASAAPSASATASAPTATPTTAPGPTARWQGAEPIRGAAGDTRTLLAAGATYRGAPLSEEPPDPDAGAYDGPPAHDRAALARANSGDGALAVWAVPLEESEGVTRSALLVRTLDADGAFAGPVRLAGVLPGVTQLVSAHTRGPVSWVGAVQFTVRAGSVHAIALRENGARAGLMQRLHVIPSPLPAPQVAVAAADDGGAWALFAGAVPEATGRDEQDGYSRVAHWHLARLDATHHARMLDEYTNNLHDVEEREEARWPSVALLGSTRLGAWFTVIEAPNRTLNASGWANDTGVHPPRGEFGGTNALVRVVLDEPATGDARGASRVVLLRRGPEVIGGTNSDWLVSAERIERGDAGEGIERSEGPWVPLRSIALRCEQPGPPKLVASWQGGSVAIEFARHELEAAALYRMAHRGERVLAVEGDLEALARPGALLATRRVLVHFDGLAVRRFACVAGDPALRELAP